MTSTRNTRSARETLSGVNAAAISSTISRAISGVTMLATVLVVASVAPGLACIGQDQDIGDGPNPTRGSVNSIPTEWTTEQTMVCPASRPVEGSACATIDRQGSASAPQCRYDVDTPCPSVCVCGYGGLWTCFASACDGILSADLCAEGEPCSDDVGCTSTTVGTCVCQEGALHCSDPVGDPRPPPVPPSDPHTQIE